MAEVSSAAPGSRPKRNRPSRKAASPAKKLSFTYTDVPPKCEDFAYAARILAREVAHPTADTPKDQELRASLDRVTSFLQRAGQPAA